MSIRVLVADDSPTIRRRASATLADAGYEVSCVEDGGAAWRELDAGHVPDVVLCDVLMPEMDGYELCQKLKADPRFARVPVMLLRGTFEPWDQARAEAVGADGFITKPFEPEALVTTLRELVEEASLHHAPQAPAAPAASEPGETVKTEEVAAHAEDAASDSALPSLMPTASDPVSVDTGEALAEAEPAWAPTTSVQRPHDEDEAPLGGDMRAMDPLGGDDIPDAMPVAVTPLAARVPEPAWDPTAQGVEAPFEDPFSLGDEPAVVAAPPAAHAAAAMPSTFDDALLDRLAERILERMSTEMVERVAWEVVPEVAEALIRKRIVDIEAKLAGS